jgi:hypothetical protein
MNTRNLASLIESYLEADDSTDGNGDSSTAPAVTDGATRQKVGQLMLLTAQLKQDVASLKSNIQMAGILPLLLNQKLTVQSAVDGSGAPIVLPKALDVNETITFKQGDALSALLPAIMMGGIGSDGSDNSTTMLLMVLALSGKL